MTAKDKALIDSIRDKRWEDIDEDELYPQCDTDEARREIHSIVTRKYHWDEYRAGML